MIGSIKFLTILPLSNEVGEMLLELTHVTVFGAAPFILDHFPPAVGIGYRVLPGPERCSGCWLSQARDH